MSPVYKLSANSVKNGRTVYGSMLAGNTAFLPTSFQSIATVTVGNGGASNVEFTSIPGTYTHLQIRASVQSNRASFGNDYNIGTINSDTGSNYARHHLGGDGSTAFAGATANGTNFSGGVCGTSTGSTFGISIIDIYDYANTNKYKTIRTLSGNDLNGTVGGYGGEIYLLSGLWMNTNAITSIKFVPNSGTLYTQHTIFALYGIAGA